LDELQEKDFFDKKEKTSKRLNVVLYKPIIQKSGMMMWFVNLSFRP